MISKRIKWSDSTRTVQVHGVALGQYPLSQWQPGTRSCQGALGEGTNQGSRPPLEAADLHAGDRCCMIQLEQARLEVGAKAATKLDILEAIHGTAEQACKPSNTDGETSWFHIGSRSG